LSRPAGGRCHSVAESEWGWGFGFEPDEEGARLEGVNEGYLVARLLDGDSVDALDLDPLFPNVLEEERSGRDVYSGVGDGALWESATEVDDDRCSSENVRESFFSISEDDEVSWEGDPLDVGSSMTGLRSDILGVLEYRRDLLLRDGGGGGGTWDEGGWEGCGADSWE
jgi:hypothetical protein